MEVPWLTGFLTITVAYLIYRWSKKSVKFWKELGVPQAETLPLIGSMKDVMLRRKSLAQLITDMYKKFEGKKFFGASLFTSPILVIRDVELINNVLIKDFDCFVDRNPPLNEELDLFNSSLASLTGDKWKIVRHRMTPTFSSGKMKLMFNKIIDGSEEAILVLKEKKGEDIDSRIFLFKYMINTLGDIAFGIKVDAFNEEKENDNLFLYYSQRLFRPSLRQTIRFILFTSAPKLMGRLRLSIGDKSTNNFFQKIVQDLISYRQNNDKNRNDFLQLMLNEKEKEKNFLSKPIKDNNLQNENTSTRIDEHDELLEHLQKVKYDKSIKVFSDNIIGGQTLIFLSGGTETTAAVLSFTLYELSVNKDIQKRAQEEIDTVLGTQDFSYEAVKKMTYLDQILNEVLRIRPPGGILNRLCVKDYKIPGTQITIKKGTSTFIPVLGIHMDPQYFSDPETFNPDRFQDMDSIPKGAFFPFGGGPRICIAMRLAMLQMKVFLATVLSNYNVILSEKTKLPLELDPRSPLQHVKGGIWVRFEQRCK